MNAPLMAREPDLPRLLMVIAEDEYATAETLPRFAKTELAEFFAVTVAEPPPQTRHSIPKLVDLPQYDAVLISVRRRALPAAQLKALKTFVAAGKPVIGIRTASHAFTLRPGEATPEGCEQWPEFDADVLGGHYTGHHGNKAGADPRTRIWRDETHLEHPILDQFPAGKHTVTSWLYKTSPLAKDAVVLQWGEVEGRAPAEPVTWTWSRPDGGRTFYTSLGHPDDFKQAEFTRLLKNGIRWASEAPAPPRPPR